MIVLSPIVALIVPARADEPPTSGPIAIQADAGAAGNVWFPMWIPFADMRVRGYTTIYGDLNVTLWDKIKLERLHYDRTTGVPATVSEGGVSDFAGTPLVKYALQAGLAFPALTEALGGEPLVRYRREVFNVDVTLDEAAQVLDARSSKTTTAVEAAAGEHYELVTRFDEVFVGTYVEDHPDDKWLIGLGGVEYVKPWALQAAETPLLLLTPLRGLGFGGYRSQGRKVGGTYLHLDWDLFLGYGAVIVGNEDIIAATLPSNIYLGFIHGSVIGTGALILHQKDPLITLDISAGSSGELFYLTTDPDNYAIGGAASSSEVGGVDVRYRNPLINFDLRGNGAAHLSLQF